MESLDCSYHVYKIVNRENNSQAYVADGTGTLSHEYEWVGPISSSDLNDLPKVFVREHLDYLGRQGFTHISKESDLYMTFSFTPTSQRVFQDGHFYSTRPLNEKEQDQFCDGVKEVHKTLENYINFESEGNPLD
jgi:hypothetical protein